MFYREALHIPPVSLLGQHGQRTGESGAMHMEGPTERSRKMEAERYLPWALSNPRRHCHCHWHLASLALTLVELPLLRWVIYDDL